MSHPVKEVENTLTDGSITYDVHIQAENNDNAIILICDSKATSDKITAFIADLYDDGYIVGVDSKY